MRQTGGFGGRPPESGLAERTGIMVFKILLTEIISQYVSIIAIGYMNTSGIK